MRVSQAIIGNARQVILVSDRLKFERSARSASAISPRSMSSSPTNWFRLRLPNSASAQGVRVIEAQVKAEQRARTANISHAVQALLTDEIALYFGRVACFVLQRFVSLCAFVCCRLHAIMAFAYRLTEINAKFGFNKGSALTAGGGVLSEFSGYDLAVIGGGINGCGIARDAAGRGLSVFLCDQGDLAGGTSSASTKLIHGGLRYLEFYEFRLVQEALAEREVLLRAAPHIIWPLRFVLPHHRGLRPWPVISARPLFYDHIGGRHLLPPTRSIDLARDLPAKL